METFVHIVWQLYHKHLYPVVHAEVAMDRGAVYSGHSRAVPFQDVIPATRCTPVLLIPTATIPSTPNTSIFELLQPALLLILIISLTLSLRRYVCGSIYNAMPALLSSTLSIVTVISLDLEYSFDICADVFDRGTHDFLTEFGLYWKDVALEISRHMCLGMASLSERFEAYIMYQVEYVARHITMMGVITAITAIATFLTVCGAILWLVHLLNKQNEKIQLLQQTLAEKDMRHERRREALIASSVLASSQAAAMRRLEQTLSERDGVLLENERHHETLKEALTTFAKLGNLQVIALSRRDAQIRDVKSELADAHLEIAERDNTIMILSEMLGDALKELSATR